MMAYNSASDKSGFGTPGLIYRGELELGIGVRSLKARRSLLHWIHSKQRAIFPIEDKLPEGCKETLPDLIGINDKELDAMIPRVVTYGEDVLVPQDDEVEITRLLDAIEKRVDEINWRAKILENIRPAQGPPLP